MKHNFLHHLPLLRGYEKYLYFGDMESLEHGIYAHTDYFTLLDEQYPRSYFILNIRDVDDWYDSCVIIPVKAALFRIASRLEHPGYMRMTREETGYS